MLPINKYQKLLHDFEMKVYRSTTYSQTPITLWRIIVRGFRRLFLPFEKRGWFGFCDNCYKFKIGLCSAMVDTDFDEEGAHAIYGMVCKKCEEVLDHEN